MKRQKRLSFVFCTVMLFTGAAFTACDDGVVIEEAKFIKLNHLNSYVDYYGDNKERLYPAVYSIGLMVNSSDEYPVYGNLDANVVIDKETNTGTATIAIYELTTPEITGEPWKGSGEYFISIGLLYGNKLDYYVSKHEVRIRRAVTEIGFEDNFIFTKTESP